MVGLKVASRKLRELLRLVVLLPEAAQDQVADAVEHLVEQLLLASRLKALPAEVLSFITRKAGRPTRHAAKLLQAVYGPFDCGIRLDGITTTEQLSGLLALNPRRFEHITSLVLASQHRLIPLAEPYPDGFIPALIGAIPKLQSLSASGGIASSGLQALAPLAPHLTSLSLPSACTRSEGLGALLQFTALHSLAIPMFACMGAAADLQLLGGLQQLQALEWLQSLGPQPALERPPGLRPLSWLACLSSLTSLSIHPVLWELRQPDLHALCTAWPHLSALGLALGFQRDAAFGELDALSQRTGLTALHLRLESAETRVDLRRLSSLRQLCKLTIPVGRARVLIEGMGEVLEAMSALTSLHLDGYCLDLLVGPVPVHPRLLATGLKALSLAGSWAQFWGGISDCLAQLTMLTRLEFPDAFRNSFDPERASGLSHLTGLQALQTSSRRSTAVRVERLLLQVAALTRLRELALYVSDADPSSNVAEPKLQHLLPLRHTLTRLTLGGFVGNEWYTIQGPGLAVVGGLTCLEELTLCHMGMLRSPDLHAHLLPLPPSLSRLELQSARVLPDVQAALQAAADKQDCGVRVGVWV